MKINYTSMSSVRLCLPFSEALLTETTVIGLEKASSNSLRLDYLILISAYTNEMKINRQIE
jgi:hypothetical protein